MKILSKMRFCQDVTTKIYAIVHVVLMRFNSSVTYFKFKLTINITLTVAGLKRHKYYMLILVLCADFRFRIVRIETFVSPLLDYQEQNPCSVTLHKYDIYIHK